MDIFSKLLVVLNDPEFQDVFGWQSAPLHDILNGVGLNKNAPGIYVLHHPVYGIVYIGKAVRIYDRLKSHYYATLGREKAPCWKEFFETIKTGITSYWYVTAADLASGEEQEHFRQILERALQLKYNPLFDAIYPRGKRVPLGNLSAALTERFGHLPG